MRNTRLFDPWPMLVAIGVLVVIFSTPVLDSPRLTGLVIGGMAVFVGCAGSIVHALGELADTRGHGEASDELREQRAQ